MFIHRLSPDRVNVVALWYNGLVSVLRPIVHCSFNTAHICLWNSLRVTIDRQMGLPHGLRWARCSVFTTEVSYLVDNIFADTARNWLPTRRSLSALRTSLHRRPTFGLLSATHIRSSNAIAIETGWNACRHGYNHAASSTPLAVRLLNPRRSAANRASYSTVRSHAALRWLMSDVSWPDETEAVAATRGYIPRSQAPSLLVIAWPQWSLSIFLRCTAILTNATRNFIYCTMNCHYDSNCANVE